MKFRGQKDKKVTVLIRRNGEKIKIAMRPVLSSDGTYKIGTWVREDTQGIGTLTYVTKPVNLVHLDMELLMLIPDVVEFTRG